MPYWKLVNSVEDLFLAESGEGFSQVEVKSEQSEALRASYELPTALPAGPELDSEAQCRFHDSVTTRTVISAARTGHLRQLKVDHIESPFAVRALLPCWVQIELNHQGGLRHCWSGAACSLRPILAHASLWLTPASASDARQSRQLTGADVQSLRSHFDQHDAPFLRPMPWEDKDNNPIGQYLSWLKEDADLAQQVADAWNAVLERGDADVIRCNCQRCKARCST